MLPVGVDIGSYSIKLLELIKKDKSFLLKNFAESKISISDVDIVNNLEVDIISETIKKIWSSFKIKTNVVAFSINQLAIFTRVLEMPEMSDIELASSINWEAESYIPLPLNQVRFEWQVMRRYEGKNGQKRMDVLLIAVPRSLIDKYYKIANSCGLELKVLEPESVSIMRAISLFKLDNAYNLIINFGDSRTDILVNNFGVLSFVRSISVGGKTFTRAISRSLEITEEQAENYKIAYGFDKEKLNGALFSVLYPIFQNILEELRRAIIFEQNKDPGKKISSIIFCGAGSALPDLNVLISEALNTEVVVADPLTILKTNNNAIKIPSGGNQKFLVAAGLAMNEIQ